MARYRKVDVRIWNDRKFRELCDDGKLVFFFLLTHPGMTAIGAMRGTVPGLAAEMGWTTERLSEAFGKALSKGMAKHDEMASLIWLPNFIRYNAPENPNVLKAWAGAVDVLPECDLLDEAIQSVKAFAEALPEPFRKALPEPFAKGMPIQEQEQEQEKSSSSAPVVAAPISPYPGIPLVNGTEYFAPAARVAEWRLAFPAADVGAELRRMRAWCNANKSKRKTQSGIERFVVKWLTKTQDEGGSRGQRPPPRDEFAGSI